MAGILRKTLKKSRDKLLGETLQAILDNKSRLEATERELQDILWQMKHNQLELVSELNRVKHSGIINISESEIVAQMFTGLKIYLDPRDVAVVPHMALDAIWEYSITKAWMDVVKPNDTVIDIGANFGYFGALAAQLTDKKHSKVIHFEANPHLIPYIRKTLAANWLNEQSVIENLAVSDAPGEVTLNLLKDYVGSSSLHSLEHLDSYMHNKMYLETAESIAVQATTIDDYCVKNNIKSIDLIKMDIEGFEEKAYHGMRKIVKASPNISLFIEFTKDSYEQPIQLFDMMLKDFGHVYVIDADGYILKPKTVTYESLIGGTDDWVMPIFSKNPKLANRP